MNWLWEATGPMHSLVVVGVVDVVISQLILSHHA